MAFTQDQTAPEDRAWPNVSAFGLLLGGLFFGLALTPSLMPRDPLMLGLMAGFLAGIGHELGGLAQWIWRFLELPRAPAQRRGWLRIGGALTAAAIIVFSLFRAGRWQNYTREVMGLGPVEGEYVLTVAGVALAVFAVVWVLARLFGIALRWIDRRLRRVVPPRISQAIGLIVVVSLFWAVIEGTVLRWAFDAADASFEAADALIEPDVPQPQDPMRTGSPASLVAWDEMGRRGREFVATAPTAEEISEFSPGAMAPIRVYVGRLAADTPEERAQIALDELIRVGGFERSTLVVMVPTGTGWMDPGSHDPLDFMLGGDVATVAVQYSYLTSVLSLIANREAGVEQSSALFKAVYNHWTTLPAETRPKLYAHGLSQGAYNSESSLRILDLLGDPIQGAFWVGSPFFSPYWAHVRDDRNPGSPVWRPLWGNGSLVRTMNQTGGLDENFAPWGPIRLVFLNYGSDPIVNFTFESGWRRPQWLNDPRPPDVAPELRWYPIVTMFQLGLDSGISLEVPRFGHYYVFPDYIDGWAALLDPPGWSPARRDELNAIFEVRGDPY